MNLTVCRDHKSRWCVLQPGGRVYGRYRTKERAEQRLAQVRESSKHSPKPRTRIVVWDKEQTKYLRTRLRQKSEVTA